MAFGEVRLVEYRSAKRIIAHQRNCLRFTLRSTVSAICFPGKSCSKSHRAPTERHSGALPQKQDKLDGDFRMCKLSSAKPRLSASCCFAIRWASQESSEVIFKRFRKAHLQASARLEFCAEFSALTTVNVQPECSAVNSKTHRRSNQTIVCTTAKSTTSSQG